MVSKSESAKKKKKKKKKGPLQTIFRIASIKGAIGLILFENDIDFLCVPGKHKSADIELLESSCSTLLLKTTV